VTTADNGEEARPNCQKLWLKSRGASGNMSRSAADSTESVGAAFAGPAVDGHAALDAAKSVVVGGLRGAAPVKENHKENPAHWRRSLREDVGRSAFRGAILKPKDAVKKGRK